MLTIKKKIKTYVSLEYDDLSVEDADKKVDELLKSGLKLIKDSYHPDYELYFKSFFREEN